MTIWQSKDSLGKYFHWLKLVIPTVPSNCDPRKFPIIGPPVILSKCDTAHCRSSMFFVSNFLFAGVFRFGCTLSSLLTQRTVDLQCWSQCVCVCVRVYMLFTGSQFTIFFEIFVSLNLLETHTIDTAIKTKRNNIINYLQNCESEGEKYLI